MAELSDPVFAYRPPGGNAYGPSNARYRDELDIDAGRSEGFIKSINKRLGGTNPGEVVDDQARGGTGT